MQHEYLGGVLPRSGRCRGAIAPLRDSRSLWRLWRSKLRRSTCNKSNNYCEVAFVHRFRCVFGGTDAELRLRCTRGNQRVRGFWGG